MKTIVTNKKYFYYITGLFSYLKNYLNKEYRLIYDCKEFLENLAWLYEPNLKFVVLDPDDIFIDTLKKCNYSTKNIICILKKPANLDQEKVLTSERSVLNFIEQSTKFNKDQMEIVKNTKSLFNADLCLDTYRPIPKKILEIDIFQVFSIFELKKTFFITICKKYNENIKLSNIEIGFCRSVYTGNKQYLLDSIFK